MTEIPAPRRSFNWLFVLVPIVAMAVAAAHWPSLSARAVSFDDDQYFVSNELVQNPSWDSAKRFIIEVLEPSTVNGYYQPLNMISLMLDSAMGATPANLRPLHRTSLLLHLANTTLIILLLRSLFGNALVAAAAGLLFGLHPMTVETIPWTGERKTLLATFFAVGCFLSYLNYVRSRAGWSSRWFVTSNLLFVLALLSKPTVTPLPILLLLLDAWPLKRISWKSIFEKAPFVLIAGISSIITFISQARTASVGLPTERDALFPPFVLCHNNIFYLWKLIWPVGLTSHYVVPTPFDMTAPSVQAGVIATAVMTPALLFSLRKTRAAVVAWLFYLVGLLPTMQIVSFSNVIASDKYAYLPSVGLLMLMTAGIVDLSRRITRRPIRIIGLVALSLLASLEFRATRNYLGVWRDTETLYRHMMALAPHASQIRAHLGNTFLITGRIDEALVELTKVIEMSPNDIALVDLGNTLRAAGRLKEAIPVYQRALSVFPNHPVAHHNFGVALAEVGQLAEAEKHFARAIELKPFNPDTHDCWAMILLQQNRHDDAMQHLSLAIAQRPKFAEAMNHMGVVLVSRTRSSEALEYFQRAVNAGPNYAEARYNLAQALAEQGRLGDARRELEELLRRSPGDLEARRLFDTISSSPGKTPVNP